jgi:phosphoribosylformylglycinamidine synthase
MELWCNESQERYVLALDPAGLDAFAAICARERAPFAVVGHATEAPDLVVEDALLGAPAVDLPLDVILGKPPRLHREAAPAALRGPPLPDGIDLAEAALRVLRLPAVASKAFLLTIGDRSVTGLVARDPMVGPWQVPVADVATTTAGHDTVAGEAMALGERAPVALIDAAASARLAVAEAITNLIAAPIGPLDRVALSANWMAAAGHPGEDARLVEAVRAVGLALCPALGLTIPVGKDSLSMRATWRDAAGQERAVASPVTLVVTAVSATPDAGAAWTPQLRGGDTRLVLADLSAFRNRLGGSALAQSYGALGEEAPDLDEPEALIGLVAAVAALRAAGIVRAYHDRSDGGLLACVAEMAFAGHLGAELDLDDLGAPLAALFAEEPGALFEVGADDVEAALETLAAHGVDAVELGTVTAARRLVFRHGGEVVLEGDAIAWHRAWSETSHQLARLRDDPACADEEHEGLLDPGPGLVCRPSFDPAAAGAAGLVGRRPRVAILREQGVNGHAEMAAAFDRAGFEAVDVHMSDLVGGRDLSDVVGLAACGGFSYGDVLGAGAGWARRILHDPRLRDVFAAFFHRPETFSLGVCNGCQAMSQLSALIPGAEGWPRFTANRSGQFEARVSLLRVEPGPSVLLAGMGGSVLPVAVAHGEGRAGVPHGAAPHVAARYVDADGAPTARYPLNPNGSDDAIAGVSTADGRVTLLMPHPERGFRAVTNSWLPDGWGADGPWLRLFRNARAFAG